MSYNISSSWRGVVGIIQPTYRPGQLEDLIHLLPEGIGVIPKFLGIKTASEKERLDAMELAKEKIAELAKLKVDLIHPQSSTLFMLRGYKGAEEIVRDLEEKHGIPIITTAMTLTEASGALRIKRMVVVAYIKSEINQAIVRYLSDAGFEVLGMEAMSVPFAEVGRLSYKEVYAFAKKLYLKHQNAQGILMIGSGWQVLEAIPLLEQDLQVPVVHPVPARVWTIQKRLHVRQPVKGYGRLLAEMP
jgi:maleate cis-trans isomerase